MSGINENEIKEIDNFLNTIPNDLHDKDINILNRVVKILTSPNQSEIILNLEDQLQTVEHILSKIIDDSYQGLLVSIQSYSHIVERVQNNKKQVKTLTNNLKDTVQLLSQNSSNTEAKWKLVSQYSEMCQLLDCISYLKTIPSLIKEYIPQLNNLIQDIHLKQLNNNIIPSLNNINDSISSQNTKLFLHSSLLVISSFNLLNSPYPKIEEGRNPIETCSILIKQKKKQNTNPPLSQIPALQPLRSQIFQLYDKFHEIITEEICFLIYNDNDTIEDKLMPYFLLYDEIFIKKWPPIESILHKKYIKDTNEYIEEIKEEKYKDYSDTPGYYMLLLVESLKTIGKEDIGSGIIASKAISEFRDIMSESLGFIRKIFEDNSKIQNQHKLQGKVNLQDFDSNVEDFILYPNCIPFPHLLSSYSPHFYSRPFVVLINTIANRFLSIIQKQIYFSQLLSYCKRKYININVIAKPDVVIKQYTYLSNIDVNNLSRVFKTSEMWELMQSEIIGLLRAQLQETTLSKDTDTIIDSSNTLFRFSDSAAFTKKSTLSIESDTIFKSSPYNIIPLYLPLIRFNGMIVSLLNNEGNTSWTLKEYLDQFNSVTLMSHIQDDILTRIDEIFSSSDVWYCPTNTNILHEQSNKPVLNCGLKVYSVIEELFKDIQAIPTLGSCTSKFMSIINNTYTQKYLVSEKVIKFLSSNSLLHDNKQKQVVNKSLRQSPLQQSSSIRMSSLLNLNTLQDNERNTLLNNREKELEKQIYSLNFDNKEKFVWDSQQLSLIASISNTMDYIYNNIKTITNQTDKLIKEYQTNEYISKNSFNINTSKTNKKLLEDCKKLSQQCLFALRTEIRMHCFYYIKQSSKCSYILDEQVEKPNIFIEDLTSDLTIIEKRIKSILSKNQLEFLFKDITALLKSLIIYSLHSIGVVNFNGVSLLRKNIFSLLQSLPESIILGNEHYIEDIRIFVDLLLLSPKELILQIENINTKHPHFTKEDYIILASSLCIWQNQLEKKGNIDAIEIQQLKTNIISLFT